MTVGVTLEQGAKLFCVKVTASLPPISKNEKKNFENKEGGRQAKLLARWDSENYSSYLQIKPPIKHVPHYTASAPSFSALLRSLGIFQRYVFLHFRLSSFDAGT